MINNKYKKNIFSVIFCISLVVGLTIYVLFRENTYVAIFVRKFIVIDTIGSYLRFLDFNFIKYYLVDYLWALSLCCGLHIIYSFSKKGSLICTVVVTALGAGYEILQYIGVVSGTFDLQDIIMYFLAGITVNIINLKGEFKNEKSS